MRRNAVPLSSREIKPSGPFSQMIDRRLLQIWKGERLVPFFLGLHCRKVSDFLLSIFGKLHASLRVGRQTNGNRLRVIRHFANP